VSSGETLSSLNGGWIEEGWMDCTKIPEHQVTTTGDDERARRRKIWFVRGAVEFPAAVAADFLIS
jgi:ribosome-associated protein YbcJ (S4-like RNA binding protein)